MPLCAAYPRQYRLRALWLGRRPCLGGGRNPPPSSSSSSFLRIPSSHNPPPRFHTSVYLKILSSVPPLRGGAHPWARTPVAEMPEASNPSHVLAPRACRWPRSLPCAHKPRPPVLPAVGLAGGAPLFYLLSSTRFLIYEVCLRYENKNITRSMVSKICTPYCARNGYWYENNS